MKLAKSKIIKVQNDIAKLEHPAFGDTNIVKIKKIIRKLEDIVNEIGWPKVSTVGEVATAQFFGIAFDSMIRNSKFHCRCLDLMRKCDERSDYVRYMAEFEDRLRVLNEQPQIYGTQYQVNGSGDYKIFPTEDVKELNVRRAKVNLDSIESFQKRLKKRSDNLKIT